MRRVELSDMDHGKIEWLLRCEQRSQQAVVDSPETKTPERMIARSKVSDIAELRRKLMAAETF